MSDMMIDLEFLIFVQENVNADCELEGLPIRVQRAFEALREAAARAEAELRRAGISDGNLSRAGGF